MSPETREKAISLIANKHLTVDSINEIVTILMLEKTKLITPVEPKESFKEYSIMKNNKDV